MRTEGEGFMPSPFQESFMCLVGQVFDNGDKGDIRPHPRPVPPRPQPPRPPR